MKVVLIALLVIAALASTKPGPVKIDSISAVYSKDWYSGYLDVENNSTHMHYIFFPSQTSIEKDPVLVWFNGGPGCSSLLGALYEHGPFILNDAFASIIYNKYSWNQKANVLYIESPAQVGFSYMDGKAPTWNDDLVAKLNAKAIREFFNTWTEFQGRDTYISGESYGGIYVPTVFYEYYFFYLDFTPQQVLILSTSTSRDLLSEMVVLIPLNVNSKTTMESIRWFSIEIWASFPKSSMNKSKANVLEKDLTFPMTALTSWTR